MNEITKQVLILKQEIPELKKLKEEVLAQLFTDWCKNNYVTLKPFNGAIIERFRIYLKESTNFNELEDK